MIRNGGFDIRKIDGLPLPEGYRLSVDSKLDDPETNKLLLRFQAGSNPIKIAEETWKLALESAVPDATVGIRHRDIGGDLEYRIHVASIPKQVGCHVHMNHNKDQVNDGDEIYVVVSGEGVLHFGKVTVLNDAVLVHDEDWKRLQVVKGDSFIIPAGYAHQLRRQGSEELVILFACPDAHLNNVQDRTMLPDAPI